MDLGKSMNLTNEIGRPVTTDNTSMITYMTLLYQSEHGKVKKQEIFFVTYEAP